MRRTLLFFAAFVLAAWAQNSPELTRAQGFVKAGNDALDQGDYRAAVESFRAAKEIADSAFIPPFFVHQIYVRAAEAYAVMADFTRAEEVARAAGGMGVAPDISARLLMVTAAAKNFRGEFTAAQADLRNARQIVRDTRILLAILAMQGESLLESGKVAEAAALLPQVDSQARASRTAPVAAAALLPVRVMLAVGDYGSAETLLAAAEPSVKSDPLARLQWGVLKARTLASSQRLTSAAAQFRNACTALAERLGESHPAAAQCWADAGISAFRKSDSATAAAWLQKAAAALARYPESHPMAGVRDTVSGFDLFMKGQRDDARAAWDRARALRVRLYGDTSLPAAESDLSIADLEIARGGFADAQTRLQRALGAVASARPQHEVRLHALLGLAKCAAAEARWQQAETFVQDWSKNRPAAAEDDPDLATGLSLQARAAWEQRRAPESETLLARAIEIRWSLHDLKAPESVQLCNRLAEIRAVLNKPRQAAEVMTQLFAREPDALSALLPAERLDLFRNMATWHEAAGQPAEAVADLRRVMAERKSLGLPQDLEYLALLEQSARLAKAANQQQEYSAILREDWDLRLRMGATGSEDALNVAAEIAELESSSRNFSAALPMWQRIADAGRSDRGLGARNRVLVLQKLAGAQQGAGQNADAAKSWIQLSRLVIENGNLKDAELYANNAKQLAPPGSSESATAFLLLAAIRNQSNDRPDPGPVVTEASSDPAVNALALADQARFYIARKDLDTASSKCFEAEAQIRDLQLPSVQATVLATRALILSLQGKADDAEMKYSQFRTAESAMDNEQDFPLISLLAEASRFYASRNPSAMQQTDLRRLEATKKAFGARSAETARAMQSYANGLTNLKRFEEARALLTEALDIFRNLPDRSAAAGVLASIGDSFRDQAMLPEALAKFKEAVAEDPDQEAALLPQVAILQRMNQDRNGAVETYTRLRELWNKGDTNSNWVDASRGLCVALIEASRADEGLAEFAKLRRQVRAANKNKDSVSELNVLRPVAEALKASGRKEAANLEKDAARMAKGLNLETRK